MTAIDALLKPYEEGKAVIIHSGRDLYDLEPDPADKITPLIELLRSEGFTRHNLVMIEFSKSSGVTCNMRLLSGDEKRVVKKCLSDFGLDSYETCNHTNKESDFVRIIRSLLKLSQQDNSIYLRDKLPLKFMVVFNFSEHLMPHLQVGTHIEEQLICIETALKMVKSLGARKYGNYVIFSEARPGTLDGLLYQNVTTSILQQPSVKDKAVFIKTLKDRYPDVTTEDNLSDEVISNLTAGTPNRSTEEIFLSSYKTNKPILTSAVFEKKQADIISLSESTLEAIDLDRIKNQILAGVTVRKPMQILMIIAESIKRGDKNCLRNVMFCGSPSGGKTMMAFIAAAMAGVPAYLLNSPKNQYVGESERKAKVMFNLLKQMGGFGIIDEVELIFPLNRNQNTGDSGVTQNLQGQLQSFLSDPSLSGKTVLVATSNRPNAISEAMRQRWTIIPVLMPIERDFPEIVLRIAQGLNPSLEIELTDTILQDSASKFYKAGAAPREIREALISSMIFVPGNLGIEHIVFASHDIIPSGNINSSIYADYCALAYTRNNSFLPWWDENENQPDKNYPFPEYIKKILNDDFYIDQTELGKALRQLEPNVNV
jgi:AAA+ superfamily predicted ATPase